VLAESGPVSSGCALSRFTAGMARLLQGPGGTGKRKEGHAAVPCEWRSRWHNNGSKEIKNTG
jgi:hypothetical protein